MMGLPSLRPRAVVGYWPANAVGDDIEIYADDSRDKVMARLERANQDVRVADRAAAVQRQMVADMEIRAPFADFVREYGFDAEQL